MNAVDLQSRKFWIVGGVALAVVLLIAAWFLAIHPKRSDAADLREQNANAQLQNAQLEAQNAALTRQGRYLGKYQAELSKALGALPTQTNLSAFSQALTAYARRTGVELTSISVGAPTAVASTAPVAPTPEPTGSASDPAAATASTSPVTPTATASATGPVSTTFTLQATGTIGQDLAFLSAVRTGTRSALITSTQFGTSASGGGVSLTAQVSIFSSPMPAAQLEQLKQLLKPSN